MYAVIFRAEIARTDEEYSQMAARLRELAIQEYGCLEFTAVTEGNSEIAISYWSSKEQILAWKENAMHLVAQEKGRSQWYSSYRVQIAEVVREYSA
ncbi:antibiotic biosynthesis monooxygenase [uncultured Amphritea sp.]|uniref:antibiotic biosynthesis monooxygenase family protein n=1 Tax=Amphritea sp. TaxID=1872502 RepID=UPI0025E62554|nr:antibiotic biosynthesis monooxygenase [uncultured Amphritea sp.]